MTGFRTVGLKARNFRCFGEEAQGFESLEPVNLVIGRNNSGKSALVEMVRYAVERFDLVPYARSGTTAPAVLLGKPLEESEALQVFQKNVSGGPIHGSHGAVAKTLAGHRIWVRLGRKDRTHEFEGLEFDYDHRLDSMVQSLANAIRDPFKGKSFRRVAAERDFGPESSCGGDISVSDSGALATTAVERIINEGRYDSALVERHLLSELNRIMGPDGQFSRIGVQRGIASGGPEGAWSVVLDESDKGRVALSDSGSGLKSILLVLVNLLLVPALDDRPLSDYVFAFEELENNLHPGLQRRLLKYVEETVLEGQSLCFVTTHSPTIIDLFAAREHAQVLHVTHDGVSARVGRVPSSAEAAEILDDLDVRASDILQTNGVVWVEGVSDRIYLRRWIQVLCDKVGVKVPVEGLEYTFMEYGGRCLSHYDFSGPGCSGVADDDLSLLIPALALSRNHVVVMDSDKGSGNAKLSATKVRVIDEAAQSWVTMGREIENYLPASVAESIIGGRIGQYGSASKAYASSHGREMDKKGVAKEAAMRLGATDLNVLDLESRLVGLLKAVLTWNRRLDDLRCVDAAYSLSGVVDPDDQAASSSAAV